MLGVQLQTERPFRCSYIIRPALHQWVTVDSAAAAAHPRSQHPIFGIPGVTSRIVRGDGLHILFTKGMFAHLLGSILHYLCWHDPAGRPQNIDPAQRQAIFLTQAQAFYREHQSTTRLTNLKLTMFCSDPKKPWANHPFLNSKGGESKHLAPAVPVCKQMLDCDNPVDQHIVEALESMCALVRLFMRLALFPLMMNTGRPSIWQLLFWTIMPGLTSGLRKRIQRGFTL